jgi:hypothetical protein
MKSIPRYLITDISLNENTKRVLFSNEDGIVLTLKDTVEIDPSPDYNGVRLTDSKGDSYDILIYDLTKIEKGTTVYAFTDQNSMMSAFESSNGKRARVDEIIGILTEMFEACCGGGGSGASMLYRVYEDGTLIEEIAAFSTEDQTININWV